MAVQDAIVTPTGRDIEELPVNSIVDTDVLATFCAVPLTYDPFHHTQFVDMDSNQYVSGAKYVWLTADKQAFCYQPQYALDVTVNA